MVSRTKTPQKFVCPPDGHSTACPYLRKIRFMLHYPVLKGAGFAVRLDQSGDDSAQPTAEYRLNATLA